MREIKTPIHLIKEGEVSPKDLIIRRVTTLLYKKYIDSLFPDSINQSPKIRFPPV